MDNPLKTVHHALADAAQEPKTKDKPKGTYTFRIHREELDQAHEICKRHGVGISEFFRACARQLVREYLP